ncbi:NAD-dependent epimerase/dehydratase family protein [Lutibacter holmesii]|uniref:NAD-dependent epimerase/dehydratase family protein n=1 Tax=Lutibacter holmesii TaxID=1137985 RepID=A0ABW3WSJ5_9FLAO
MKKILVTGAAGFIGSAIAKKLLSEGNEVVTIDNLSTGKREVIPEGCEFIEGNVYDVSIIDKLVEYKFDIIIHFAGQSSGEVSFEDPVYDLKTNTQSTVMLLDFAKKTGCKEFIYASSMSVYGDHEDPYVDELSFTKPKSFYAIGKMASEHYMRIYSGFGIKTTALRLFNVYGIGQNLDNLKQGMASIFLAQALKDNHIFVKGAKDRFRDFVYIDDVVEAVILSIGRKKGDIYDFYNVSNGEKVTVERIINTIKLNLPYDISVEYGSGTPGDQNGIYGDSSKIYNDLGWTANSIFKDGMKKMINYYANLNR